MLYDNIMVPYDGSESARAALAEATRFAREDPGLNLRLVQIIDSEQLVIDKLEKQGRGRESLSGSEELRSIYDAAIKDADTKLHAEIDGLLKGLMNKVVVELIEETIPGDQIITYANDHSCDIIVMGSRGLGKLRGFLGSVSSHVLRNAEMPVLIVK